MIIFLSDNLSARSKIICRARCRAAQFLLPGVLLRSGILLGDFCPSIPITDFDTSDSYSSENLLLNTLSHKIVKCLF